MLALICDISSNSRWMLSPAHVFIAAAAFCDRPELCGSLLVVHHVTWQAGDLFRHWHVH